MQNPSPETRIDWVDPLANLDALRAIAEESYAEMMEQLIERKVRVRRRHERLQAQFYQNYSKNSSGETEKKKKRKVKKEKKTKTRKTTTQSTTPADKAQGSRHKQVQEVKGHTPPMSPNPSHDARLGPALPAASSASSDMQLVSISPPSPHRMPVSPPLPSSSQSQSVVAASLSPSPQRSPYLANSSQAAATAALSHATSQLAVPLSPLPKPFSQTSLLTSFSSLSENDLFRTKSPSPTTPQGTIFTRVPGSTLLRPLGSAASQSPVSSPSKSPTQRVSSPVNPSSRTLSSTSPSRSVSLRVPWPRRSRQELERQTQGSSLADDSAPAQPRHESAPREKSEAFKRLEAVVRERRRSVSARAAVDFGALKRANPATSTRDKPLQDSDQSRQLVRASDAVSAVRSPPKRARPHDEIVEAPARKRLQVEVPMAKSGRFGSASSAPGSLAGTSSAATRAASGSQASSSGRVNLCTNADASSKRIPRLGITGIAAAALGTSSRPTPLVSTTIPPPRPVRPTVASVTNEEQPAARTQSAFKAPSSTSVNTNVSNVARRSPPPSFVRTPAGKPKVTAAKSAASATVNPAASSSAVASKAAAPSDITHPLYSPATLNRGDHIFEGREWDEYYQRQIPEWSRTPNIKRHLEKQTAADGERRDDDSEREMRKLRMERSMAPMPEEERLAYEAWVFAEEQRKKRRQLQMARMGKGRPMPGWEWLVLVSKS
ncbi:hypothetical protein BCR44DRAFT_1449539 [Catenaria anguillulae PL171]|uniref:Uncharacterized protein n=1 Tax=Catenaria anguillulae PL171 TaxID=765915 RepID=A0A1Y2H699_9FUNG|nr:hypothetical protein BCR44DRAFT_1449539 [Catenaria anguillulae PL171]